MVTEIREVDEWKGGMRGRVYITSSPGEMMSRGWSQDASARRDYIRNLCLPPTLLPLSYQCTARPLTPARSQTVCHKGRTLSVTLDSERSGRCSPSCYPVHHLHWPCALSLPTISALTSCTSSSYRALPFSERIPCSAPLAVAF
jgi:hypothetical protein